MMKYSTFTSQLKVGFAPHAKLRKISRKLFCILRESLREIALFLGKFARKIGKSCAVSESFRTGLLGFVYKVAKF